MVKKYVTGDIRNGTEVLDPMDRKTILILSDDLRMHSGIATMTKEFVLGNVHRYNFIQLAAAIKHPEKGSEVNLDVDTSKFTGVESPKILLIPSSGYGTSHVVRSLLSRFTPELLLIFTDPRYFRFIFEMESEIRETTPIAFYTIWDNTSGAEDDFDTDPLYNSEYYASMDGLFCISKQTYGIVNRVIEKTFGNEFNIVN